MIIYANNECIFITTDSVNVDILKDKGVEPNGEIKTLDTDTPSTAYYYKVTDKFIDGIYKLGKEFGYSDGYQWGYHQRDVELMNLNKTNKRKRGK